MPRTTYSDLSLPNLEQDFETEKRSLLKHKSIVHKKRSRNIAKPLRKKNRKNKVKLTTTYTKGAFSPVHQLEMSD